MKKIKIFLPVLMALVMLLSIPFAAACKNKKKEPSGGATLQSISVSGAKDTFVVGEEFSSEGLVVQAHMSDSTIKTVTDNAQVDSSAYNKDVAADYEIIVSYTEGSVTKTANYSVTVSEAGEGIEVSLAPGVSDTYALTAESSTVEIDVSKIVVNSVNPDGTTGGTVASSQYTARLYKGQQEVPLTGTTASVGKGIYNIWVSMESPSTPGYLLENFVVIYVDDPVTDFAFDSEHAGTLVTQTSGADIMSPTWYFTVTYSSGTTKSIDKTDSGISITGLSTSKATDGEATATVTYTEKDIKNNNQVKTCEVKYTVTQPTGPVTAKEYTVEYKIDATNSTLVKTYLVGGEDPETANVSVVLNGATTFGTNSKTTSSANGSVTYADRVEIKKNKTVDITLASGLTNISIDVYASHTTGGTSRTVIIGTTKNTDTEGTSLDITGGSSVELSVMTLAGAQAGKTYYVSSKDNSEGSSQTIHFYAVRITYTVPGDEGGDETTTYTYDFSELQAKLLERVKALPQNQNPNNNNEPYYTEDTLGDKIQLEASDFEGTKNGFITFLSAGTSKSTQYRTSSGGCIEIKGDRLQFTLTKPGTVTVIFSSTGTNVDSDSDIAPKDASGNYMTSNGTPATDNGYYTAHGTGQVTITFVVSQAGTYTLTTGTSTHDRAARIYGITVVDGTN